MVPSQYTSDKDCRYSSPRLLNNLFDLQRTMALERYDVVFLIFLEALIQYSLYDPKPKMKKEKAFFKNI